VFSTPSKQAIFVAELLYQLSNQQYARYNQAIVSSIDRVVITGMLFRILLIGALDMTSDYTPVQRTPVAGGNIDQYVSLPTTNSSAVSWGAIFAGAAGAASLAMLLLMLGVGLGLSSVSPYGNQGVDAGTIGIATIAWLMFTQIAASGMGGYLAGRLRSKWVDTHTDEVYFRDTAHGFLAWAVAALVSAMLLTSAIGSIIGGGAKAVGSVAGGVSSLSMTGMASASNGESNSSMGYFVNSLFRTTTSPAQPTDAASSDAMTPGQPQVKPVTPEQSTEVAGIFLNSINTGALPADDLKYVASLVAQNTGMNQQEAEQRVQNIYAKAQTKVQEVKAQAKEAADKARKTSSYLALWTFVSLLSGAFIASLCATFGGRQRDL